MPCNYNPMTDAVETLGERYAREVAEDAAYEAKRLAGAMKAVDEVSKQHYRTAMTYGIVKKAR